MDRKRGTTDILIKKVPTESILEDIDNLMEQDESLNEDKLRFVVDLLTAANFNEKEFLLRKSSKLTIRLDLGLQSSYREYLNE